jgi:hypothetical protein
LEKEGGTGVAQVGLSGQDSPLQRSASGRPVGEEKQAVTWAKEEGGKEIGLVNHFPFRIPLIVSQQISYGTLSLSLNVSLLTLRQLVWPFILFNFLEK